MTATLAPPDRTAHEGRAVGLGRRVRLVAAGGRPDVLDRARARLARFDRIWAAEARQSDLARLARRPGTMRSVEPETVRLVSLAAEAAAARGAGTADVLVDARHGRVGVSPGADLDLPFLARALAADLLVEAMLADGASGALASVGDCVRAACSSGDPAGWLVPASGPAGPTRLESGASASWRGPHGTVLVVADEASRAAALARAVDPREIGPAERLLTAAGAVGRVWMDGRLVPVGSRTRSGAGVLAAVSGPRAAHPAAR